MDVIGDILSPGYPDTILCVGLDKVTLIDLLEGSSRGLVEIVGSTDQDHGPIVSPGIGDSRDSIGVAGS